MSYIKGQKVCSVPLRGKNPNKKSIYIKYSLNYIPYKRTDLYLDLLFTSSVVHILNSEKKQLFQFLFLFFALIIIIYISNKRKE